MQRLENRGPIEAPRTETPAQSSPKATTLAATPARQTPASNPTVATAQPLIIKAAPPPPRASAVQLMPPEQPASAFVEAKAAPAPAVAAPPPPALVVVGTHKPAPVSHGSLKTFLWVLLALIAAAGLSLTLAPVREQLVAVRIAIVVWFSRPNKTGGLNALLASCGPLFGKLTEGLKTGAVAAKERLSGKPATPPQKPAAAAPEHQLTPAELLLKKRGTPLAQEVHAAEKAQGRKSGGTTTLMAKAKDRKNGSTTTLTSKGKSEKPAANSAPKPADSPSTPAAALQPLSEVAKA